MLHEQSYSSIHEIHEQIKAVLEELRPTILQDGGEIHFVRFDNGVVYVSLHGACATCPISFMTLTMGLEVQLKQRVTGVERVVSVDE